MNNFRPFFLRIWSMRLRAAEDAGFVPYLSLLLDPARKSLLFVLRTE